MQAQLLKQIAQDVIEIKQRVTRLETTMEEIDVDLHDIKPEYLQKLKKIDEGRFLTEDEFEKELKE